MTFLDATHITTNTPLDNNAILVTMLRMTSLIIGYLTIRLGYLLICSGAKGDFKFTANYHGIKSGLVSSSPGLLFVLLGTILIGYTLSVYSPFKYSQDIKTGTITQPNHLKLPAQPIPGVVDSL